MYVVDAVSITRLSCFIRVCKHSKTRKHSRCFVSFFPYLGTLMTHTDSLFTYNMNTIHSMIRNQVIFLKLRLVETFSVFLPGTPFVPGFFSPTLNVKDVINAPFILLGHAKLFHNRTKDQHFKLFRTVSLAPFGGILCFQKPKYFENTSYIRRGLTKIR